MTNDSITKQRKSKFDLEDRTLQFSKRVIRLCKALPKNVINNRMISQVIGTGYN